MLCFLSLVSWPDQSSLSFRPKKKIYFIRLDFQLAKLPAISSADHLCAFKNGRMLHWGILILLLEDSEISSE